MELTIAFLQLIPEDSLEKNMEKGIWACREAKRKGTDIALFPEMLSSGYCIPHQADQLHQRPSGVKQSHPTEKDRRAMIA